MSVSPAPLSLDTVVRAAVDLIEADGLGALTMRGLAKRLGCSPMALYRYVATKQDLIRAIGQYHLHNLQLPDTAGLPWQDAIVAVVVALHQAFLERGSLLEIVAVQHVDAMPIFAASEVILDGLRRAGVDDRDAVRALSVITSYAVGATQRKAEQRAGAPAEVERLRRLLQLPEHDFPNVRRLAGQIVTVDFELSFEDGLRLLLQGIAPSTPATR